MEQALEELHGALDAVEVGIERAADGKKTGGGDDDDAVARVGEHAVHCAAAARRALDQFYLVRCRDAENTYIAATRRRSVLRARLDRLRRQHDVLGLAWHDDVAVAEAEEARRAASAALEAYGRDEVDPKVCLSFSKLPAHDQDRLEQLFREGRLIAKRRDRAHREYAQLSARRVLARAEAKRVDDAIVRGFLDPGCGHVTALRAWAAFFRQTELTFSRSKDEEYEDIGGCCDDGGVETESAKGDLMIVDRLCFDIAYKMQSANAAALRTRTEETLSFRTRRGYKSAHVWINAVTTTEATNDNEDAASTTFSFRSDVPLPKLGRDGASFLESARPSALFVSAFISDCVWPDLVSSSSPSTTNSSPQPGAAIAGDGRVSSRHETR